MWSSSVNLLEKLYSFVVQDHNIGSATWQSLSLIATNCEIGAEARLRCSMVSTYVIIVEVGWVKLMANTSEIAMGLNWPNSMGETFGIRAALKSRRLTM